MPTARHVCFQFFKLFRRQMRAAVKGLMLAVVGVYGFHGFLRFFKVFQFLLQLLYCLRVVCADTAHAGAADFIKKSLYVLPFPVIAVAGCVLLFFLPCGEVRAARNEDRGNTRVNLIAFVHVRRQFPGVGVKQAVDFLMVHRVYPLFLPFCKLYGFIYIVPVFSRRAALLIIRKAVHILCTFGGSFIDCVIRCGGGCLSRLCSLRCFAVCACISFRLGLCFFFLYRGCFFGKLRRGCFCFGLYGSFLWGLCLFGGLFLILCLLDFCKMSVYGINQTCGGAADCFKRAFQFCKFFSAAPPGDISKGIVRRIKPVVLANRIGDAFCLYLAGAAVGTFRRVFVYVMECCMGDFMDCGLDVLQFVHTLVDRDTLFLIIAASFYAAA